MVNTIKNVKMIITAMYSTQYPLSDKGVETAATVSLPSNYRKVFLYIQYHELKITIYFIIKSHHINLAHFHCCEGGIVGFGGYTGTASRINADFCVWEKCL